jgi:hypothetical protein
VYNSYNDQHKLSIVSIDCSSNCIVSIASSYQHHTMKTYVGMEVNVHMFNSNIQKGLLRCNRKCRLSSLNRIPRPRLFKIKGCSTSQRMQSDHFIESWMLQRAVTNRNVSFVVINNKTPSQAACSQLSSMLCGRTTRMP